MKFPLDATGSKLREIVSAANNSFQLKNLAELALAGGGRFNNCSKCGKRPGPKIQPPDLRKALKMLLPIPQPKILRLNVAPNFLDILDLQLYKSIADGLPALENLWLGHPEFPQIQNLKRRHTMRGYLCIILLLSVVCFRILKGLVWELWTV
jgi:hypothetical protein